MKGDERDRGVSSTISVVLLVALVVIAASAVGAYTLQFGDRSLDEPAPEGSFDFAYQTETGELKITYTGGETIDTDRLSVEGPRVSGEKFTESRVGETVEAGESVTVPFAQLGDQYRVVWATEESSSVIAKFTPPTGVDYVFEYSPETDAEFTEAFDVETEQDIRYVSESAYTIRIDERNSGSVSEGKWVADIENTENVTVVADIRSQVSYHTGVEMYAVDENGDKIVLFCGAGHHASEFTCNGGRFSGTDKTYSVTSDAKIDKVVLHYRTHAGWEPIWIHEIKIAK